jgi:N utilization substance protein A
VTKVVLDEESNKIEVVVPDDQLSLAIGRRGQNVRLASQLTGWQIDIETEAEESEKRQTEFKERSQLFIDALDVDEVIAQLMVTEGFSTIEEVAYVPIEELAGIEGFDEDVANELHERATNYLEQQEAQLVERWKSAGVSEDLLAIPGVTHEIMAALGSVDPAIKTRDDLADLAGDELVEIVGKDAKTNKDKLSVDDANAIIMAARAHWFADEAAADQPASNS